MSLRFALAIAALWSGLTFADDRKPSPHAAEKCNAACMKTASQCQVACAKGDTQCQTGCALAFSDCSEKCPPMPEDPADAPKRPNPVHQPPER